MPPPPVGDLGTAAAALQAGTSQPRMKPYEPEWDLAEAAVPAAELQMDEAADRAAWAAGVAADHQEWNVVLAGYHDAARYGAAQQVLAPIREAAALSTDGHADLAIADRLHISTRTVQTHLAHIYAKLGINRRADLGSHPG